MPLRIIIAVALMLFAGMAFAPAASAQATRTWVSGVGDDANPCSRTAPCKTLAGAISKTATGGEISVLDPAALGALTIAKPMTIITSPERGGILASLTNGVTVNVGAGQDVYLEGLTIQGGGNGLSGIRMIGQGTLHVRNCIIRGFTGPAISVEGGAGARVFVDGLPASRNAFGVRASARTAPRTPCSCATACS